MASDTPTHGMVMSRRSRRVRPGRSQRGPNTKLRIPAEKYGESCDGAWMRLISSNDAMPPAIRSAGSAGPRSSTPSTGNAGVGSPRSSWRRCHCVRTVISSCDARGQPQYTAKCSVNSLSCSTVRSPLSSASKTWASMAGPSTAALTQTIATNRRSLVLSVSVVIAGYPHAVERGIRRGEQRRAREPGVVGEDANVLGQQLPGDGGEAVEGEPATGDDLGGVAPAAARGEDRRDRGAVELTGCGQLEHLGCERELGGEHHVVQELDLLTGAERADV